jgi:hypothetical protein
MARGEHQIKIRFPDEMVTDIRASSLANGRSMNAEIVAQLRTGASKRSEDSNLRDTFAGQALAGFCANPAIFAGNDQNGWDLVNCTEPQLAQVAYRIAGEMIAAREGGAA